MLNNVPPSEANADISWGITSQMHQTGRPLSNFNQILSPLHRSSRH
jgi:hypothetical protein